MIYVIRDTLTGHVKIGISEKPWHRLRHMQTSTPGELEMVTTFEGDVAAEQALHARFAEQRYRGEWFTVAGGLAEWLETLAPVAQPLSRKKEQTKLINRLVEATGVPSHTAYMWVLRDSIPSRHWHRLIDAGILTFEEICARAQRSGKVTVTA